jgi:hypothetical protein
MKKPLISYQTVALAVLVLLISAVVFTACQEDSEPLGVGSVHDNITTVLLSDQKVKFLAENYSRSHDQETIELLSETYHQLTPEEHARFINLRHEQLITDGLSPAQADRYQEYQRAVDDYALSNFGKASPGLNPEQLLEAINTTRKQHNPIVGRTASDDCGGEAVKITQGLPLHNRQAYSDFKAGIYRDFEYGRDDYTLYNQQGERRGGCWASLVTKPLGFGNATPWYIATNTPQAYDVIRYSAWYLTGNQYYAPVIQTSHEVQLLAHTDYVLYFYDLNWDYFPEDVSLTLY